MAGAQWQAVWAKLPTGINGFNPIYALTTAYSTDDWREVGRDLAYTALDWGGLGAICTALAVWRLRPAYIRQLTSPRKRRIVKRLLLPRPAPTGPTWRGGRFSSCRGPRSAGPGRSAAPARRGGGSLAGWSRG